MPGVWHSRQNLGLVKVLCNRAHTGTVASIKVPTLFKQSGKEGSHSDNLLFVCLIPSPSVAAAIHVYSQTQLWFRCQTSLVQLAPLSPENEGQVASYCYNLQPEILRFCGENLYQFVKRKSYLLVRIVNLFFFWYFK